MISAERLTSGFKANPTEIAHALGESLRDFGYPSITDDWVETEIKMLLDGGDPGTAPSMFLFKWLKDGIE